MTTRIQIETAAHAVTVRRGDRCETVPPHSVRVTHVWKGEPLTITEVDAADDIPEAQGVLDVDFDPATPVADKPA